MREAVKRLSGDCIGKIERPAVQEAGRSLMGFSLRHTAKEQRRRLTKLRLSANQTPMSFVVGAGKATGDPPPG